MMKATEIMIGDWVCYSKANGYITKPQRVCSTSDEDNSFIRCVRDDRDPLKERYPVDDFNTELLSPIPLTAEILERNGFVLSSESSDATEYICALGDGPDNNLFVWLFKDRDFAKVYYCPLNVSAMIDVNIPHCSVHQLQHALRLCNIDKDLNL